MNDINEMPPKCQSCPYWEVCEYPWVCPDKEQPATNLFDYPMDHLNENSVPKRHGVGMEKGEWNDRC